MDILSSVTVRHFSQRMPRLMNAFGISTMRGTKGVAVVSDVIVPPGQIGTWGSPLGRLQLKCGSANPTTSAVRNGRSLFAERCGGLVAEPPRQEF
jgi:hypothetical protein